MTNIYSDIRLRVFLSKVLKGRNDLIDDMISDCMLVVLDKYDVDQLERDGVLIYVIGRIATYKSHRFHETYGKAVFDFEIPTDPAWIKTVDQFAEETDLTQLDMILLDAIGTDNITSISKHSGVSYRCLRGHINDLKQKYNDYRRERAKD